MVNSINSSPLFQGNGVNMRNMANNASRNNPNIVNGDEVRTLTSAIQATANRSAQPGRPVAIDTDTYLAALTPEQLLTREELAKNDFYAQWSIENRLNNIDYNNLSEDEFRILMLSASRHVTFANLFDGGGWRDLDSMIGFIEDKLNSIDNNLDISPERRAIERSIWEEGFVRALSFYQHNQRTQQSGLFTIADRATAEANVQSAMTFAFGVIQNVASLSDNTNIQDLIIRGMEGLIEHEIHMSSQAYFKFMLSQRENEDSARATRNDFTQQMREMVEAAREQVNNMEVKFALLRSLDIRV